MSGVRAKARARGLPRARALFEEILGAHPGEMRARQGLALLFRREGLARIYASTREGEDEEAARARVEAGFDAFRKAVALLPDAEENSGPKKMMRTHASDCARRALERMIAVPRDS